MTRKFYNLYRMLITSGPRKLAQYIFYRIRNELCRLDLILKGANVGRDNFYYGRVEAIFHNGGNIKVGNKNNFGAFVQLKVGPNGDISIGDNCTISRFCILQSSLKIVLEDGVQIAPFVHIVDARHYFADEKTNISLRELDKIRGIEASPVTLCKNAWIGSSSVILKGVTIGEGAVIGAGSVVTKDIPPHTVAVGVPCKVIRMKQ